MKYRLVIFDFDGTLADTFPWFKGVIREVARQFDFKQVSDEELEAIRGLGSRQVLQAMQVPPWKLPAVVAELKKRKAAKAPETPLFPGAATMLAQLKAIGVTIAIVSSDEEANIRVVLGPQAAACVDAYACGARLFGKATIFREVLRKTGVPASETLCIGDEVRDIEAANEAGIAFGAVSWGFATVEALAAHGPKAVFASMEEITALHLG